MDHETVYSDILCAVIYIIDILLTELPPFYWMSRMLQLRLTMFYVQLPLKY